MRFEDVFLGAFLSVVRGPQNPPNLHALVGVNPRTKAICVLVWVGHKPRVSEQVPMGHLQRAQTDKLRLDIRGKRERLCVIGDAAGIRESQLMVLTQRE